MSVRHAAMHDYALKEYDADVLLVANRELTAFSWVCQYTRTIRRQQTG